MRRNPELTSRIMREVRSKNTSPEMVLAAVLRSFRIKFRKYPDLPGKPDFIIPVGKIAIFCDGDFWHGYGWRERGFNRMEDQFKRNKLFWISKIRNNMRRDVVANISLRKKGWHVLRFRESKIKKDVTFCLERIILALEARVK